MEYMTTAEFAEKWGISQRRVGISNKPEDSRKVKQKNS